MPTLNNLLPRAREDDGYYFWWTETGVIVKWVIFLVFWIVVASYFIFGRASAKRRARAGQKPFPGTAWFLSRAERARVDPAFAATAWPSHPQYVPYPGPQGPHGGGYYNYNGQQNAYGMQDMQGPPLPVYNADRPPQYQQENGAYAPTKAEEAAANVPPPPGPPPPR